MSCTWDCDNKCAAWCTQCSGSCTRIEVKNLGLLLVVYFVFNAAAFTLQVFYSRNAEMTRRFRSRIESFTSTAQADKLDAMLCVGLVCFPGCLVGVVWMVPGYFLGVYLGGRADDAILKAQAPKAEEVVEAEEVEQDAKEDPESAVVANV